MNCPNLGQHLRNVPCDTCRGKVELKVFSCTLHKECTIEKQHGLMACCKMCFDNPENNVIRVDKSSLVNGPSNARFNASIIRYKGRLLLAYRTGWQGARIHITELTENFQPIGKQKTLTPMSVRGYSEFGQEDPRLFIYKNELYVSFTGVSTASKTTITNVLFARLSDTFEVKEIFTPAYFGRNFWEKNWVFFEWQGMLLALYSIKPFVVLHIQGNTAYPFSETNDNFIWNGGELRGGCPPVFYNGLYYVWFHGRVGEWSKGRYNIGLLTFDSTYAFRIKSISIAPVFEGDFSTLSPDQQSVEPAVVFPCGAIIENGVWRISMGVHDRNIAILSMPHEKAVSFLTDI